MPSIGPSVVRGAMGPTTAMETSGDRGGTRLGEPVLWQPTKITTLLLQLGSTTLISPQIIIIKPGGSV